MTDQPRPPALDAEGRAAMEPITIYPDPRLSQPNPDAHASPSSVYVPPNTALSLEQRAAIRARCEAATKGPWTSTDTDEGNWIVEIPDDGLTTVGGVYFGDMENNTGQDIKNADFVAAARTDVPALLDDLDAADAALVAMREERNRLELENRAAERHIRRLKEVVTEITSGRDQARAAAVEGEAVALREGLTRLEWAGSDDCVDNYCLACLRALGDGGQHGADCWLVRLLASSPHAEALGKVVAAAVAWRDVRGVTGIVVGPNNQAALDQCEQVDRALVDAVDALDAPTASSQDAG